MSRTKQHLRAGDKSPRRSSRERVSPSSFRARLMSVDNPKPTSHSVRASGRRNNDLVPREVFRQTYRQLNDLFDGDRRDWDGRAELKYRTKPVQTSRGARMRECLAQVGSKLHMDAIEDLSKAHESICNDLMTTATGTAPLLAAMGGLYANAVQPLSATRCHSDVLPSETISNHLAGLRRQLEDAQEELRKLGDEYDRCVDAEKGFLAGLMKGGNGEGPDGHTGLRELDVPGFKKEAEQLSRSTMKQLEGVDAEYRAKVHRENVKWMQMLMED